MGLLKHFSRIKFGADKEASGSGSGPLRRRRNTGKPRGGANHSLKPETIRIVVEAAKRALKANVPLDRNSLSVVLIAETGECPAPQTFKVILANAKIDVEFKGEFVTSFNSAKERKAAAKALSVLRSPALKLINPRYSSGFQLSMEDFFRANHAFPNFNSLQGKFGMSLNREGYARTKRQLIEYYADKFNPQ